MPHAKGCELKAGKRKVVVLEQSHQAAAGLAFPPCPSLDALPTAALAASALACPAEGGRPTLSRPERALHPSHGAV